MTVNLYPRLHPTPANPQIAPKTRPSSRGRADSVRKTPQPAAEQCPPQHFGTGGNHRAQAHSQPRIRDSTRTTAANSLPGGAGRGALAGSNSREVHREIATLRRGRRALFLGRGVIAPKFSPGKTPNFPGSRTLPIRAPPPIGPVAAAAFFPAFLPIGISRGQAVDRRGFSRDFVLRSAQGSCGKWGGVFAGFGVAVRGFLRERDFYWE